MSYFSYIPLIAPPWELWDAWFTGIRYALCENHDISPQHILKYGYGNSFTYLPPCKVEAKGYSSGDTNGLPESQDDLGAGTLTLAI